jgi:hypothetical protein
MHDAQQHALVAHCCVCRCQLLLTQLPLLLLLLLLPYSPCHCLVRGFLHLLVHCEHLVLLLLHTVLYGIHAPSRRDHHVVSHKE